MLHKTIRDLVEKYTFITKTTAYAGVIKLYYKNSDTQVVRFRKLPYRATKEQLIRTIDSIKKEIGWYSKRIELSQKLRREVANKEILISYIGEGQ